MKLYIFPPSTRVLAIVALKNHLAIDCEIENVDLGRGDQLMPEYMSPRTPTRRCRRSMMTASISRAWHRSARLFRQLWRWRRG